MEILVSILSASSAVILAASFISMLSKRERNKNGKVEVDPKDLELLASGLSQSTGFLNRIVSDLINELKKRK